MTIQLSANSFLQMLGQSGLLTLRQREAVTKFVQAQPGATAAQICDWLVAENLITRWQGEKLLQAKYRGFFLGPYRLLDRIARGGMSTIYSAQHGNSKAIHALKVLPPARTAKASYLPRFRREAEMTQRLSHPNIVRVFGVYEETDGQSPVHFMAMELLKGQDLFEIVNQRGPLSIADAVEFTRQAALGLQCAHQHGLVHRDIKPGNLFLTTDRVIRILDLGLAQDFDSDENLTRDFNDKVLGTADYLAPEQAADSHNVDARADLYSLGCTLYFLLSARPPFTAGTLVQRLVAHQTKIPIPLSNFRSDVPDSLTDLVRRMMAKNRNDRIDSAATVAEVLSRIQGELAQAETPETGVLEPETNVQHHVETATGTSDDSWPDELWQAIAGNLSPSDQSSSIAETTDGWIEPSSELESVSETASNSEDLSFDAYLLEIEQRCCQDPVWRSRGDAQRLIQVVRELRENRTITVKPSDSSSTTALTKSGMSWSSVFLLFAAILAALAVAASRL